jgi:fatty acid-binding protein DegV
MKKMKIVTDSGTDSHCLNTNNFEIHEVSLKVSIGEKVYLDGQGQALDQFYQSMETSEVYQKPPTLRGRICGSLSEVSQRG